ncbi:MAG: hypothetical protein EXR35_03605 [Limnohabitans sp.]|nr:hypothetical protein [Limnohabitans sp.]
MNHNGLRIVDLLWHQATIQSDHIALNIDGQTRTYAQISARVQSLMGFLSARFDKGDRVGLWFHNCHSWVETFLALNALAMVSVPINTRLTGVELNVIFNAAQLKGLVTTDLYRGRHYGDEACTVLQTSGMRLQVLWADDALAPDRWNNKALNPNSAESALQTPSGVFCIQYTSGTTSIPKGVMLTNLAYVQTANYVARCQRLTPSSRFISAGPFFHCSGSMHALTVCLLAGCTLYSMSVWDPQRFLDDVHRYQCDVSHMVYFRDVLALGHPHAGQLLQSMQITHDLGTPDYLMRVVNELGIAGVSNIYGMTETSGQLTMWFPDDPLHLRVSGNGRVQAGNQVRIADPQTSIEVAHGETGEIQMRGSTISEGYFLNEQAQQQSRTPDGWFRSGDLGRMGEKGQLIYVARLKEIIRVGGENLAPAEVEQALRDICGTPTVCVLGIPDARLDEVVVAVVSQPTQQDWNNNVQQLRQRLADFKVPRAIYLTDQLPMTATNRVQRATLKAWIEKGRLQQVV